MRLSQKTPHERLLHTTIDDCLFVLRVSCVLQNRLIQVPWWIFSEEISPWNLYKIHIIISVRLCLTLLRALLPVRMGRLPGQSTNGTISVTIFKVVMLQLIMILPEHYSADCDALWYVIMLLRILGNTAERVLLALCSQNMIVDQILCKMTSSSLIVQMIKYLRAWWMSNTSFDDNCWYSPI